MNFSKGRGILILRYFDGQFQVEKLLGIWISKEYFYFEDKRQNIKGDQWPSLNFSKSKGILISRYFKGQFLVGRLLGIWISKGYFNFKGRRQNI